MPTQTVLSGLMAHWTVAADRRERLLRVYLDTADWRVFTAGWTLEFDSQPESHPSHRSLCLRDRRSDAEIVRTELEAPPAFGRDLPAAGPWAAVGDAVDTRRLIIQAELHIGLRPVRIVNVDGKTTARVVLEHHQLATGNGARHRLTRDAALVPVRGYDRVAAKVAAHLGGPLGLPAIDRSLLVSALAVLGRPSPGTRLGPAAPLAPAMPAGVAMSAVLGRLRQQLIENEQGVRSELDTEFLHDYRVALRRGRTVIRQVRDVLPPDAARALAAELAWLADLTGPVRDLDVHLLELPGTSVAGDLAPLRAHLTVRRAEAQAALVEALDSQRYRELLESWQGVGQSPGSAASAAAPLAERPVREVIDASVERAYRRVLRRGRAIRPSTAPEALHDLRKRGKELRYLLECFQHLYPDEARAAVVRELKALQDNLGEFQDCQVQAAAMRTMADELLEARAAPAATLMAMGRLADGLEAREANARAEFASRFGTFDTRHNRSRFHDLLAAGSGHTR
jgi:CHAD domain-containing protein